jgi:uncharacterized membrane protein YraQ (UPF0718 family)
MTSTLLWGFVLRFGQGALEASLTVVVGLLVAAFLRRIVGAAGTRRLFGSGFKGLLRGWLVGMLLPVCSLGVIPVAREMRRAGVPAGTVLAFVLAAPLLNPISFLYGLTLAEPLVICCFIAASLFLSMTAGILWDRVLGRRGVAVPGSDEPLPAAGPRRLLAVAVTAARELTGRYSLFLLCGLAGSAALAVFIPFGSLQPTMQHDDWTSPLLMALVGLPIYSAPLPGMMKIGLMFEHGNSVGAAFVFFTLGIGMNLGLLAWLGGALGRGRAIAWLAAVVAAVLALAYLAEPLLFDTNRRIEAHTHAFDDFSSPFVSGTPGVRMQVAGKLGEKFGALEQVSMVTLGLIAALGLVLRMLGSGVERWLTAQAPAVRGPVPWWNRGIPGPVVAGLAVVGLCALAVAGAYIYYPPPDQVLTELLQLRADVIIGIRTGRGQAEIRDLEHMDDLTRKLQVGSFIRSFRLNSDAGRKADELRDTIEEIRDLLLAGKPGEAKAKLDEFEHRYQQCRDAFRD